MEICVRCRTVTKKTCCNFEMGKWRKEDLVSSHIRAAPLLRGSLLWKRERAVVGKLTLKKKSKKVHNSISKRIIIESCKNRQLLFLPPRKRLWNKFIKDLLIRASLLHNYLEFNEQNIVAGKMRGIYSISKTNIKAKYKESSVPRIKSIKILFTKRSLGLFTGPRCLWGPVNGSRCL